MRASVSQKERAEEMCMQYKEKCASLEEQVQAGRRSVQQATATTQKLQQEIRSYRNKLKLKNEILLKQESVLERTTAKLSQLQQTHTE